MRRLSFFFFFLLFHPAAHRALEPVVIALRFKFEPIVVSTGDTMPSNLSSKNQPAREKAGEGFASMNPMSRSFMQAL